MNTLRYILLLLCSIVFISEASTQTTELFPLRGLAIAAPGPGSVDRFVKFMHEELATRKVNTLILRIDYRYQYISRPELVGSDPLSKKDIKKLVEAGKELNIRLIPQVNLFGHQSWQSTPGRLIEVYPQFDETPHIELPEEYAWPNDDDLYCKSYCPLHPDLHEVVFDIVDEIIEVFEADAFHAGLDEVFYIADPKCPRCNGKDPAKLFADEVTTIRDHLAERDVQLWIWGDRLLDGNATGLGMWEASTNGTHQAIDIIPKDVFICDWHYERADPTAVLFALKGFNVATCPWRDPQVALDQLQLMKTFREQATAAVQERYAGMIHTCWSSAERFMEQFYSNEKSEDPQRDPVECFRVLFERMNELNPGR